MPWMRWPTYAFGGTTTLFDADVSSYCDRIPPTKLRTVAAERIADGVVLHLLEYRYLVCASDDDPPEPLFDQFVRLDVIHSTVRVCRPRPGMAKVLMEQVAQLEIEKLAFEERLGLLVE